MSVPLHDFGRYLAAKRTVDDRALNRVVWARLAAELAARGPGPLTVLEIGAGIGTMLDRACAWKLFDLASQPVAYHAIDHAAANIAQLRQRGRQLPPGLTVTGEAIDLFDLLARPESAGRYDVVIAHAFLDLVELPTTVPQVVNLLKPDGLLYATINFDGVTALEPVVDPELDTAIERLYHASMDTRIVDGRPSGDSHSGRHLLRFVPAAGAELLEAGASDWVVFAGPDGRYPDDEAFFLHFILGFVEETLRGHPELDPTAFDMWLATRHAQITRGELIYLAHQLDLLARRPRA